MRLALRFLDGVPEFVLKAAPKRGLTSGLEEDSKPCFCRWFRESGRMKPSVFKETLYTQKPFQKFKYFWTRPIDSGWRTPKNIILNGDHHPVSIHISLSLRVKHVERNHVSTISTMLTERTAIKSQDFLLLYVLPALHALTPHLLSGGQPVFPRIQPSAKTSGERNEIRPRQRCRGVLV